LALVALGLGVRDWAVSRQLAAAPLTWQLAPTGASAAASGTLVYLPNQGTATLALESLPQLPSGRVYEVWLIQGGTPQPEGVFSPAGDGSASAILKAAPLQFDTVAVTEEPGPNGSASPTSPPFLAATLKR
jgi:hypothetical protein